MAAKKIYDNGSPYPTGSPEYQAWRRGAQDEAEIHTRGMSPESSHLYDYVETLAQQERSADAIVRAVTLVYTADWSLLERLGLVWEMLYWPVRRAARTRGKSILDRLADRVDRF